MTFYPAMYFASAGTGSRTIRYKAKSALFTQGGPGDSVFYIQSGQAKLSVVSNRGKEATVMLLEAGDFIGEESISDKGHLRTATASATTACVALQIDRQEMLRVLHEDHHFSEFFLQFVLARAVRRQADLIDQLINSSQMRLARTLLLMADYGEPRGPVTLIAPVTQETLAEIIGTTRSRVSFFMNHFRRLGYIEYDGRIRVHKSLLNIILRDQLPEKTSSRPVHLERRRVIRGRRSESALR